MSAGRPPSSSDEEWLSVAEVADRLGVSKSAVYKWVHAGELRAWRVGPKRIRLRGSAVEKMLSPVDPKPWRWWLSASSVEPDDGFEMDEPKTSLVERAGGQVVGATTASLEEDGARPVSEEWP